MAAYRVSVKSSSPLTLQSRPSSPPPAIRIRRRSGDEIDLSSVPDDVIVFHAGTTRTEDGVLRTSGGRVFAVTGVAPTFAEAQERSRHGAEQVQFAGRVMRRDIGWRENARRAGVT